MAKYVHISYKVVSIFSFYHSFILSDFNPAARLMGVSQLSEPGHQSDVSFIMLPIRTVNTTCYFRLGPFMAEHFGIVLFPYTNKKKRLC